MKYAIALAAATLCPAQVAFVNGLWFNGQAFTPKAAYAIGGKLTFHKPAHVESTVDLAGAYVVAPFGEAHNHNVEPLNKIDELVQRYLSHGIFYVKNPNCLPGTREQFVGKINNDSSINVVFSNGSFSGPGGHPMEIVERNIKRGIWTEAQGEGQFYYEIDSPESLDLKWPRFLATKPDFVKTYLLYSEEYVARKDDKAFFGWKGLDPVVLTAIVRKAHAAGLRVSTHIETAADFHNALIAGVDEINHMPGFRKSADVKPHPDSTFEVTDQDAELAARNGTFVVTTLGGARNIDPNGPDQEKRRSQDELNIRNLRKLAAHHVRLAIGSDDYRNDALPEALYLAGLHALDNRTLLNLWCENTAQTIFPKRKIGRLQEGYEANFLALEGDPISDFSNVTRIKLRVKHGKVLSVHRE